MLTMPTIRRDPGEGSEEGEERHNERDRRVVANRWHRRIDRAGTILPTKERFYDETGDHETERILRGESEDVHR